MTIYAVVLFESPCDEPSEEDESATPFWLQTMCDKCLAVETQEHQACGRINDKRVYCEECGAYE